MKVKILETEIEMEKSERFIDEFDRRVAKVLEESGLYLNHLLVDGVVVDKDYTGYISENLDQIECIEVKTDTLMDVLDNALHTGSAYLKRALPEIRQLGSAFYQQPEEATWSKFEQMLGGLGWIMQMLRSIIANQHYYLNGEGYEEIAMRLKEEVANLDDAVSGKNMVSAGDLILYEIVPLLESLENQLDETLNREVVYAASH